MLYAQKFLICIQNYKNYTSMLDSHLWLDTMVHLFLENEIIPLERKGMLSL